MYSTVIGKTSYQFNASSLPSLWVFNVKLFLSFFSYHIVSVILITLEVIVQKKKSLHALVDKMSKACLHHHSAHIYYTLRITAVQCFQTSLPFSKYIFVSIIHITADAFVNITMHEPHGFLTWSKRNNSTRVGFNYSD